MGVISHLIYNINLGHNKELMEQCKALSDYSYFISRVRYYHEEKGYPVEKAVDTACMECIEKDILREFLLKNRSEVMSMFLVDYKPSLQRELDRKEGYEDGFSKGEASGMEKGEYIKLIALIRRKIQKQKSLEQIANELEEPAEEIRPFFDLLKKQNQKTDEEIFYLYQKEHEIS